MPYPDPINPTTGELVTPANYLTPVYQDLQYLKQVGFQAFSAAVTLNTTTVATAVQIVSLGAITYEAVPHIIEWFAPRISSAAIICNIVIRDGTTVIGTVNRYPSGADTSPWAGSHYIIPTAASHTYNLAGWVETAGSWIVQAGSGGTAGNETTHVNGWIRVSRVPT